MRRSVSRASKLSYDGQEYAENPLPGVPDSEWLEFLEKEETDIFILGLREEIVQKCMEICFRNYLEKQAVGFTVHCAYLAWCKVINMYYMFRDPGDRDDPEVRESWEPDEEPPAPIIDSWGIECIEAVDCSQQVQKSEKRISKIKVKPVISQTKSLESCSFISDLFYPEEGEFLFLPDFNAFLSSSKASHEPSIFTKTLSMSRESLPLIYPTSPCETLARKKKSQANTKFKL